MSTFNNFGNCHIGRQGNFNTATISQTIINGVSKTFINGVDVTEGLLAKSSGPTVKSFRVVVIAMDKDGKEIEDKVAIFNDDSPKLQIDLTCEKIGNVETSFGSIQVHANSVGNLKSVSGEIKVIFNGDKTKDTLPEVGTIQSSSGNISIQCNTVQGVTTASGDVEVNGVITGDVRTVSGDVKSSGNIEGSVSTMSGDISSKKRFR